MVQTPAVRRLVVLADTHIPSQYKRQVASVIRFIGDIQPDELIHLGDLMDFPQPSRWSKDSRAEFEGSDKMARRLSPRSGEISDITSRLVANQCWLGV